MFSFLEKKFGLSVLLLASLALLAALATANLGGRLPELKPLKHTARAGQPALPGAQVESWFAVTNLTGLTSNTNALNPFYTLHFQPPPPPPPPPTKKVELLYQGCLIASSGKKLAYVKLGESLLVLTNGAKIVADHAIKDIAVRTLSLTNAAGLTNVLEFNVKKALDVPAT